MIEAYRSGEVPAAVILDDPVTVSAYAAYRMPATVAALRSALGELYDAVPDLAVTRLVDLGGGTGAAGWAVASLDGGLAQVDVLEQSAAARAAGAQLARRSGIPALVESRWHAWTLGTSQVPAEVGDADLAVVSYVVGELSEALRREAVEAAASLASTVLVIEPGTPAGHRRVLTARDQLLALGLRVAAPCPHESRCPLADGDWCHFPARVERSALHRTVKGGELSYEDEKFSYVVATRLPGQPGSGRVLRHPLLRKGLVGLRLCLPDGTAAERMVSKRQGADYKQARKTSWGDAVR
nr:small ribosomal subunit Rsm22 family protein [Arsenicicoccus dermatophilus]